MGIDYIFLLFSYLPLHQCKVSPFSEVEVVFSSSCEISARTSSETCSAALIMIRSFIHIHIHHSKHMNNCKSTTNIKVLQCNISFLVRTNVSKKAHFNRKKL